MRAKRVAGFALLLSVVMLGAFISGCIDQGNVTRTVSPETGSRTTAPTESTATEPLKAIDEEILALVGQYENAIDNAKAQLEKTGFEIKDGEFSNWDAKAEELREMADNEKDPDKRAAILYDLARLRYYELLNLQSAVGISAVEKAYWKNATTGEPIEAFYNRRGDFFYAGDGKVTRMGVPQMVEKMYSITEGYELESIEIYQVGTGSVLVRSIREGGRTVGAGQVAIKVHAKGSMTIKTNGNDFGILRLVDPNTGETVMRVAPDEKGTYNVPPVNTTLLGIADDGGFCYRPLPLDENHMELMPITDEVTLDEVLCAGGGLQIAPFVFDPTDGGTGPYDPAPMEDLYLMSGQYTVQIFVMKADLKQLAEQLVNINVRMGGTKVETRDAKRALDAFQNAVTFAEASMSTPAEACSCTVSPLLNGIFRETFGGEPFDEVPAPESINITDFGTGPFIPVPAEGVKDYSAEVRVFIISDSKGNVNILINESGISEGERLAPSYLNRAFIEVVTARNPQTGKEVKIVAFKILNTDGTVAVRGTIELPEKNLVVSVIREGREGKLSNAEQASER